MGFKGDEVGSQTGTQFFQLFVIQFGVETVIRRVQLQAVALSEVGYSNGLFDRGVDLAEPDAHTGQVVASFPQTGT